MKCTKCKLDFEEREIDESHDVPCYLFFNHGKTRRERKHFADKMGRHYLCKGCHKEYEEMLRISFIFLAKRLSKKYFGGYDEK